MLTTACLAQGCSLSRTRAGFPPSGHRPRKNKGGFHSDVTGAREHSDLANEKPHNTFVLRVRYGRLRGVPSRNLLGLEEYGPTYKKCRNIYQRNRRPFGSRRARFRCPESAESQRLHSFHAALGIPIPPIPGPRPDEITRVTWTDPRGHICSVELGTDKTLYKTQKTTEVCALPPWLGHHLAIRTFPVSVGIARIHRASSCLRWSSSPRHDCV